MSGSMLFKIIDDNIMMVQKCELVKNARKLLRMGQDHTKRYKIISRCKIFLSDVRLAILISMAYNTKVNQRKERISTCYAKQKI